MNGIHDLGGLHGFGPVEPEADEPVFHADWERTAAGVIFGTLFGRAFNVDRYRFGIESLDPATYLTASYYERAYRSVEAILIEKGYVTPEELAVGRANPADRGRYTPGLSVDLLPRVFGPAPPRRVVEGPVARFRAGEPVIVRNIHPTGHTRVPRYVRGKRGTIAIVHDVYTFPDTNAAEAGRNPEFVYNVAFTAHELWGPDAVGTDTLRIDLWESYLDPA